RVHIEDVLYKKHYTFYQVVNHRNTIYYESNWIPKDLLDDEMELGYEAVRTKINLASKRTSLNFEGLVEHLKDGNWENATVTDDRREYFKEITLEIRNRHGGLQSLFYSSN